jgi:hypothetical protein
VGRVPRTRCHCHLHVLGVHRPGSNERDLHTHPGLEHIGGRLHRAHRGSDRADRTPVLLRATGHRARHRRTRKPPDAQPPRADGAEYRADPTGSAVSYSFTGSEFPSSIDPSNQRNDFLAQIVVSLTAAPSWQATGQVRFDENSDTVLVLGGTVYFHGTPTGQTAPSGMPGDCGTS